MEAYPTLSDEGLYLALGGGAARGLAHLGVLRALEEQGIPIAGICGTSMGAVIGAGYALSPNADQLTQDFVEYVRSTHYRRARYAFMRNVQKGEKERKLGFIKKLEHGLLLGRSLTTGSVISFENFKAEIDALVPDRTFKDTKIPFFAVAADIKLRREVVFHKGLLRSAVLASSSIPGAFPAVRSGSAYYVDGGWVDKVPAYPLAAMGGRHILAVDVYREEEDEINFKRGYSVINQANIVTANRLMELQLEFASVVWRPPVKHLHWAEFTQIEQAVEIGYTFTRSRIEEVQRLLDQKKQSSWIQNLARQLRPNKPPAPPRFPFEMRAIWEVQNVD